MFFFFKKKNPPSCRLRQGRERDTRVHHGKKREKSGEISFANI
jgi:hypothetical protein